MQKDKKKFYKTKWFLAICLLLFSPLGIILLWIYHKKLRNYIKIIISVVFFMWFMIPKSNKNNNSLTPITEITQSANKNGAKIEMNNEPITVETTPPEIKETEIPQPTKTKIKETTISKAIKTVMESYFKLESSLPKLKSTLNRELRKQDIEDACDSFFGEIIMEGYKEITWGVGTENGIKIDSTNVSSDLKSGDVKVSYTLLEGTNSGVNLTIMFYVDVERIGISEILVNNITQEIPDSEKESLLIWLLLDINYKG